jgi:hypothetical protein
MAPFLSPVTVMILAGVLVLKERRAEASADAFAAWKKWGSFFLISCAAIVTVFQLLPVLHSLGIRLPSSVPIVRLLLAGYGLVLVVSGNRAPKLPPLQWRRPGMLSLGIVGQVAMSPCGLASVLFWRDDHRQCPVSPRTADRSRDGIAGPRNARCDFGKASSTARLQAHPLSHLWLT